MPKIEGPPQGNVPESKRAPLPYTYFVAVDFDVPLPNLVHPAKEIVVFGFDARRVAPILIPYPITGSKLSKQEQKNAGRYLTNLVRQEYRSHLGIKQALRFLPLKDLATVLSPFMRNEIGYSLLSLAEDPKTKNSRAAFRTALWNTGAMFLLSVGAFGPVPEEQKPFIEGLYEKYYAPFLGPIPEKFSDGRLRFLDAFVQGAKNGIKLMSVNDLECIADMGHAFTFVLQRITSVNGGTAEIVTGPRGVPEGYGTPVGSTWFALPA